MIVDTCRLETSIVLVANVERINVDILPFAVIIEEPVKEDTLTELMIEVEPVMDCTPRELVVMLDAVNEDN